MSTSPILNMKPEAIIDLCLGPQAQNLTQLDDLGAKLLVFISQIRILRQFLTKFQQTNVLMNLCDNVFCPLGLNSADDWQL